MNEDLIADVYLNPWGLCEEWVSAAGNATPTPARVWAVMGGLKDVRPKMRYGERRMTK